MRLNKCCGMKHGVHKRTCLNNAKRQQHMRERAALRKHESQEAQCASEDADVEMFGSYNPDLGDLGCK